MWLCAGRLPMRKEAVWNAGMHWHSKCLNKLPMNEAVNAEGQRATITHAHGNIDHPGRNSNQDVFHYTEQAEYILCEHTCTHTLTNPKSIRCWFRRFFNYPDWLTWQLMDTSIHRALFALLLPWRPVASRTGSSHTVGETKHALIVHSTIKAIHWWTIKCLISYRMKNLQLSQ